MDDVGLHGGQVGGCRTGLHGGYAGSPDCGVQKQLSRDRGRNTWPPDRGAAIRQEKPSPQYNHRHSITDVQQQHGSAILHKARRPAPRLRSFGCVRGRCKKDGAVAPPLFGAVKLLVNNWPRFLKGHSCRISDTMSTAQLQWAPRYLSGKAARLFVNEFTTRDARKPPRRVWLQARWGRGSESGRPQLIRLAVH